MQVEKLWLLSKDVLLLSQFQHFEPLKDPVTFPEGFWNKIFAPGAAGVEAMLSCMDHQPESWQVKGVKGVAKFVLEISRDQAVPQLY